MGSPLIMYLSRSKVLSIWPDLKVKPKSIKRSWEFKTSLNLSINPKLDIAAKMGNARREIPTRSDDENWPPYDSENIAKAIDNHLHISGQIGSVIELEKGRITSTVKIEGILQISDKMSQTTFDRLKIKSHSLEGKIICSQSENTFKTILSLDSIAGIDYNDGWEVWESGARFMLDYAMEDGYPFIGLFVPIVNHTSGSCSLSPIYLANNSNYPIEEMDEFIMRDLVI